MTAETATAPRTAAAPPHPGWTLFAASFGFLMVSLDATIVNVALPTLGRELGAGLDRLQWVVDGYTLMFAALQLLGGSLSDRLGARRAFSLGLGLFVVASVGCGLAVSPGMLIAARFAQGAGAALQLPASLAMVRHAYADPAARARAIGAWAAAGGAAVAAGPVLGGLLLAAFGWRSLFLVNLLVGVVGLLATGRAAAPRPDPARRLDLPGQVTVVLVLSGLTFGLIEGGPLGWTAAPVLSAFAVAAAAGAVFVRWERRAPEPMLPLRLAFAHPAAPSTDAAGSSPSPTAGTPSVAGPPSPTAGTASSAGLAGTSPTPGTPPTAGGSPTADTPPTAGGSTTPGGPSAAGTAGMSPGAGTPPASATPASAAPASGTPASAAGAASAAGFVQNFAYYGIVFLLSLFLQTERGHSALLTGLVFLPMSVCSLAANLIGGRLTVRVGPRLPLVGGQLLFAVGLLALLGLLLAAPAAPAWAICLVTIPVGAGGGMAVPAMTSAMIDAAPSAYAGVAAGVLNTARQLGGAVGVALFGTLVSAGFTAGLRASLTIAAAALVLASAATARRVRARPSAHTR